MKSRHIDHQAFYAVAWAHVIKLEGHYPGFYIGRMDLSGLDAVGNGLYRGFISQFSQSVVLDKELPVLIDQPDKFDKACFQMLVIPIDIQVVRIRTGDYRNIGVKP